MGTWLKGLQVVIEGFTAPVPMPATAARQPVLAEGVPQSGAGWLQRPSTHAKVWMLLVSWACHIDVHEAAEGLCVDAALCCLGKMKGLIKPELPKT